MVLSAAVWLSGCASGQMNRIDANRGIYETWPLETRQAILDGKVEPGMTPDMVKVAWGEPSEVVRNPQGEAGDEVWLYKTGGEQPFDPDPGAGNSIGISTGRRGTSITQSSSMGVGIGGGGTGISGGIGGGGIGTGIGGGTGGMGGGLFPPAQVKPTPLEVREVVFHDGIVFRADEPPEEKPKAN